MIKRKKLLICFILALLVVSVQFTLDRQEHLRFLSKGIITRATTSSSNDLSGAYAHISFMAANGQKVEQTKKCSSKQIFDQEYAHLRVIYNPDNPEDFMNVSDFGNYSLAHRLVFFFGIYLTFLNAFVYVLDRNVRGLYKFFKTNFRTPK